MTYTKQAALETLGLYRTRITRQQFTTIRGQILAGDSQGAMRGLMKLLCHSGKGKDERHEQEQ